MKSDNHEKEGEQAGTGRGKRQEDIEDETMISMMKMRTKNGRRRVRISRSTRRTSRSDAKEGGSEENSSSLDPESNTAR